MNKPDHNVDRRADALIVRDPLDEVKAIQTLLADVYKDAGDGRTLLRELVQNADDAGASRLVFAVLGHGWSEARNSLLHGPALVVANDGPFRSSDRDGLHRALGGSKADEAEKVGRFGIGLKSVFHACEAFIYVGAEGGTLRPGALNPWAGTGGGRDSADPVHPDWNDVDDDDLERLLGVARLLLGPFADGFVLWVPLRIPSHVDRAVDRPYGLGQVCPTQDAVASWFGRPASLALLLAQCGHLVSIEADRAAAPEAVAGRTELAKVARPDFVSRAWVGRHRDDDPVPDRAFHGRIEDTRAAWSVTGVEALGRESLRELKSSSDWPSDAQWRNGRSVLVPRKALAHAAITVLRSDDRKTHESGARLRWAVYLPLDDDPEPISSPVVETVGRAAVSRAWDIVLHGYFWPSQDRRSIPGVTNDDLGAGDTAARSRWNRAVRDELLLPLLPTALASAVRGIPQEEARELLDAVVAARTVRKHLPAVTSRHLLLPVVTADGVRWAAHDVDGLRVFAIPDWTSAPAAVRARFAELESTTSDRAVFIDADAPRLAGDIAGWSLDRLQRVLNCVHVTELRSPQNLTWLRLFIRHVLGVSPNPHSEQCATVARWVAKRIGEGALPPRTSGAPYDSNLRDAWRDLFATLPGAWLVDALVGSTPAVVELAKDGLLGDGLLLVPLGHPPRSGEASRSRPDIGRVDGALLALGKLLRDDADASQRSRLARLLLAETLLSVRGSTPLGADLAGLPLLRALRLPDEKDEPWSVAELRRHARRFRVFARPSADDDEDGSALDTPSDPKRAVKELAEALGESVWLVDDSVAATVGAPVPTPTALARAVLQADAIQAGTTDRVGLLRRFAESAGEPAVDSAVRVLLTGHATGTGEVHDIFYVRSQDSELHGNRKTLEIMLKLLGRSWCAVEAVLVEPLPHGLVERLRVKAIDIGVLHQLLQTCLASHVPWPNLEREDALHLIRRLHRTTPAEHGRWCEMPLHRVVGGGRDCFDTRALRATGELQLPPELQSEVRLLDPDAEVENLYLDVRQLDHDGMLRQMLLSPSPQRFAPWIVSALRPDDGDRITLPRDAELRQLLQEATWLPRADDSGVAPQKVLLLPPELQSGVAPLAEAGALDGYYLPWEVETSAWEPFEEIVHELLKRPSRAQQVNRLANAIEPVFVACVDEGSYLIHPVADDVDTSLIEDALQTPLAGSHPGWTLVRSAVSALELGHTGVLSDASAAAQDAVVGFARSLCGPISAGHQVSTLATIAAAQPPKDSRGGRLFRRMMEAFAAVHGFFDNVLPQIELPTQDGQWHPSRDVARSASGIARRHRLTLDLRNALRLEGELPVRSEASAFSESSAPAAVFKRYFSAWAGSVPGPSIGAFLSLLGDAWEQRLVRLAEQWLGEDVSVAGLRASLNPAGGAGIDWSALRVRVDAIASGATNGKIPNVLGELRSMELERADDTLFAFEPELVGTSVGSCWYFSLCEVDTRRLTAPQLLTMLGGTVEWWAVHVLRLDLPTVRVWWSRWGTGSQAQVGPVRASVLAHLPLTLRQLNVHGCPALWDGLRGAERAQRRREQAPPTDLRDAMDAERAALDQLAGLIVDDPGHRRFLWQRVQELMQRYGYRADSVLLELTQNADDALAQAAEIKGGSLAPEARRLVVRVHQQDGMQTVDILHHGRPINDVGGGSFAAGRERQWDQDLYFMMLLNLSGKPGEKLGQSSAAATTGRFGLGFKSVHLVSETPSVVSGFIAFSVAGGLMPFEQPVPDDADLIPIAGHRATRVRLPLRDDVDATALIAKMFGRFRYAEVLLPTFARQISEVVVDGGPYAGVSAFHAQPLADAPGWSLAADEIELPGHGRWRLLRFRPADAGAATGTSALAIGVQRHAATQFPSDLPFLWNVTPTSEGWGCGYAVNGPFKLDPGRTHVSLDDPATLRVVNLLGDALGTGLVELHDALLAAQPGTIPALPTGETALAFLGSLWTLLASGIDKQDDLRRNLLLSIHGRGRGVSVWMSERSVVPSGLRAPFLERLPPLKREVRVEVAAGGLDSPDMCRALAEIDEVVEVIHRHQVVSSEVANRLKPLLEAPIRHLQPVDVLGELVERWDHVIKPERLHALRPLVPDGIWRLISRDQQGGPWLTRLLGLSVGSTARPLRELLFPRSLPFETGDRAILDELLRAAFAPDDRVLGEAYIGCPDDLTMFVRLRVRHQVDAALMATWFTNLPASRQPAALRYLLQGQLQYEVLQRLVPLEKRPLWLQDRDAVHRMLGELGAPDWQIQSLLGALFPDASGGAPELPLMRPLLSEAAKRDFFDDFEAWWDDPDERDTVIAAYEAKAWPAWLRRDGLAEALQDDSHDHWLGLLVLGACRSLGRAKAGHHRAFLEMAHEEGWWEVFKVPDDKAAWMDLLRGWQDTAVANLIYPRWMSLFPAIYQLSRYLAKYRRLLKSSGLRQPELLKVARLLAPRVDDALTGAGQNFDAPPAPLNMGVHWILRELVRLGVVKGEHVFPACWVPSRQVLDFLHPLGMATQDSNAPNADKAQAIFDFLATELDTEAPHLHLAFDIPLRHVSATPDLRQLFGLEE